MKNFSSDTKSPQSLKLRAFCGTPEMIRTSDARFRKTIRVFSAAINILHSAVFFNGLRHLPKNPKTYLFGSDCYKKGKN
jgi:hypothetical protein